MGKTIRRKTVKNRGYYSFSSTRGSVSEEISDNIFHSDKPHRWSGISSTIKEEKNTIFRAEKRIAKHKSMKDFESEHDLTDMTCKKKANEGFKYS